MHSSIFFKIFPPPKFLLMPHAGVDVSDDSITFVEYSRPIGERYITKYGIVPLPPGIVEGGDIKDEEKLVKILSDMARTNNISYAKLSIPEEKAYLFEVEVPYGDMRTISQNIEFKLEENIPLSAADAVFAFDVLIKDHGGPWHASVSAVPRTYIEHMMNVFNRAGITPISFETAPRAISRVISGNIDGNTLLVHPMRHKTGVYIISQGAVGFTSTLSGGFDDIDSVSYLDSLSAEISRVNTYWNTKSENDGSPLKQIIVVGHDAEKVSSVLRTKISDQLPVDVVNIWHSILNTQKYVPPILKKDSYEYAGAAGLAI